MKSKLIIVGSRVRRLPEKPSWGTRLRSELTARNIFGLLGILAIAVWIFQLITGGA
jgi:hypothetical protein